MTGITTTDKRNEIVRTPQNQKTSSEGVVVWCRFYKNRLISSHLISSKAGLSVANKTQEDDLVLERETLRSRGKGEDESVDGAVEGVYGERETAVGEAKANKEEQRPRRPFSSLRHNSKSD